jgi:hypothetical protein
MAHQFDPNLNGWGVLQGTCTKFDVIDPVAIGNLVIDPSKGFDIELEWTISGNIAALWLNGLGGDWQVQVFAESVGPGTDVILATEKTPAVPLPPPGGGVYTYSQTLKIAGGAVPLQENNPGVSSGVYKLTATVFLNSNLGAPGFDISGFCEGPTIMVENPV